MRFFERIGSVAAALVVLSARTAGGQPANLDSSAASAPPPLDEIVVTADFRNAKVTDVPASVSVIDAAQLRATTVEHFEGRSARCRTWTSPAAHARAISSCAASVSSSNTTRA